PRRGPETARGGLDGPLRPRLQTRRGRRGLDHRLAYGYGSHSGPATSSGSHDQDYRLASRRAPPSLRGRRSARTTRITDSPRTAGPQPRDVLRLALPGLQTRLGRRAPSPATSSGSHYHFTGLEGRWA